MTAQPKERPILFNAKMVRAILTDNKTQTRRIIKPQPVHLKLGPGAEPWDAATGQALKCPYGSTGDRLWVRETWAADHAFDRYKPREIPSSIKYNLHYAATKKRADLKWRPSIFMPRYFSRIDLEITRIRIERLQAITEIDAEAEGTLGRWDFSCLWRTINGNESWEANPRVWVVEFRVIRP